MPPDIPAPLQGKIALWLIGIAAAGLLSFAGGFITWSFAVDRAINAVENLGETIGRMEQRNDQHDARPWHAEAGTRIRLIEEKLERIATVQLEVVQLQREILMRYPTIQRGGDLNQH